MIKRAMSLKAHYRQLKKYQNVTLEMLEQRGPELTLDDAKLISKQLGFIPYNLIKVGKYIDIEKERPIKEAISTDHALTETDDNYNNISSASSSSCTANSDTATIGTEFIKYPVVSIVYPLNSGDSKHYSHAKGRKPFPTVIWLTCPFIHARVSMLEDMGLIAEYCKRIQENTTYLEQMRLAHERYAAFRWSLLTPEDVQFVAASGWENRFQGGIAGMQELSAVKCLHTHYAHFLARPQDENLIGAWVQEELNRLSLERNGADDYKMSRQQHALYMQVVVGVESSGSNAGAGAGVSEDNIYGDDDVVIAEANARQEPPPLSLPAAKHARTDCVVAKDGGSSQAEEEVDADPSCRRSHCDGRV